MESLYFCVLENIWNSDDGMAYWEFHLCLLILWMLEFVIMLLTLKWCWLPSILVCVCSFILFSLHELSYDLATCRCILELQWERLKNFFETCTRTLVQYSWIYDGDYAYKKPFKLSAFYVFEWELEKHWLFICYALLDYNC